MQYFELSDRLNSKFKPFVERGTSIRRPGGCPECSTLPVNSRPPDILNVQKTPAPVGVVSFTSWGFGVIAVELLEMLRDDVARCLKLGQLADAKGKIIQGFHTFVGVERIRLRGDRNSYHRVCRSCGALIYTYMPRDSPYVTIPQVATSRGIYGIESMGLLVNERIRDQIGNRWWDLISLDEVPVLAEPRDGLPADLGLWPSEDQLINYTPNPGKWLT